MYKTLTLLLVVILITSTCNEDNINVTGMVNGLDCAGAIHSGNLTSGNVAVGVSSSISYSGGNGGVFDGQVVNSTGVTGLVAILNAGNFEDGDGSLTYSIAGVPLGIGTANFPVSIGGQNCTLSRVVNHLAGTIGNLNCTDAVNTGALSAGVAANGVSASISYTGGDGGFYSAQTIASIGVTGLTANLSAGNFAIGSGNLIYTIAGIPSNTGVANFVLNIGGHSCILSRVVVTAPTTNCGAYVAAGVWKEIMCHNLGANTSADPMMPSWELIGNYYQWGRNPTCFGRDGVDGTNPCGSPVYGAAGPWGSTMENDNAGDITGWSTVNAPNGAWKDSIKTANDPCPIGFRIPTAAQWDSIASSNLNQRIFTGTWTISPTNYSNGLKIGTKLFLPATGARFISNGSLISRGIVGNYWSSTESGSGTGGRFLNFSLGTAYTNNRERVIGLSVRCIAE